MTLRDVPSHGELAHRKLAHRRANMGTHERRRDLRMRIPVGITFRFGPHPLPTLRPPRLHPTPGPPQRRSRRTGVKRRRRWRSFAQAASCHCSCSCRTDNYAASRRVAVRLAASSPPECAPVPPVKLGVRRDRQDHLRDSEAANRSSGSPGGSSHGARVRSVTIADASHGRRVPHRRGRMRLPTRQRNPDTTGRNPLPRSRSRRDTPKPTRPGTPKRREHRVRVPDRLSRFGVCETESRLSTTWPFARIPRGIGGRRWRDGSVSAAT